MARIESFTGIRPGSFHYGNIALLQKLPKGSIVMIANFILPVDRDTLESNVRVLKNMGLSPVLESDYAAIMDIFLALARHIRLSHTLKSVALRNQEALSLLDYNYPALMTADVLFFRPKEVYVGRDQETNIEFYRDTCSRLKIETDVSWKVFSEGDNVQNLYNIAEKMSKSSPNQRGVISVGDSIEALTAKINAAPTSSLNVNAERNPFTDNLMRLYAVASEEQVGIDSIYARYDNLSWSKFKGLLIDRIADLNRRLNAPRDTEPSDISNYTGDLSARAAELIDRIRSI